MPAPTQIRPDAPGIEPTSYDAVPYSSYAYAKTHPDHLATIAKLFGADAPPVASCRVLELGCASGGNLIPLAEQLPGATLVGVDLSARQIDEGRAVLGALRLPNVELLHRDILDIDVSLGTFDYILCHGVYSWVPPAVQEKILSICRENLQPQGVAYVSYNTYPGWHLRAAVREMMKYHAARFDDLAARVHQSRALLDFLIQASPSDEGAYPALLRDELEIVRSHEDTYLFHEHLEDFNQPVYFHQFIERAESAGLRYLAEAHFSEMVPGNFPPEVETTLREIAPDIVHMEQYMDFLRNRKFRRTLLCRREVELQRHLEPSRLAGLRVASPLVPESGRLNPRAAGDMRFQHPQGGSVTVGSPLEKAALLRLHEIWPRAETLSQICDGVRLQLGDESGPAEKDVERLGEMVLQTFSSEYVELRCGPDRFVTRLGEKPRAGRVARFQAAAGHSVTNQLHETVVLGRFDRHLVCLLDGKRDRTELVKELHMLATSGEIQITSDGQPVTDRNALRDILTRALEESLPRLASLALLVPSE